MAIQTKNLTVIFLLIAIIPRFMYLSKADTRLVSDALIAMMKIIEYFKKNYQSLTFVGHFGVRVVEGQLKLLLLEYENGRHRIVPATIMTQLRQIVGEATKVANMAVPHLLDQDPNQFNKLHHQIQNPWLMFHPHRLVDHKSHRYPYIVKPSKNLIEESNRNECILELTGTKSGQQKCQVKEPCLKLMTNPEYHGYNLQHQILYSAFAEKIGCSDAINAYLKDHGEISSLEQLQKVLCSISYYELQHITSLYGIPASYRELFLLTQFICPNLGFFEFLHKNWLELILSWQKPSGCFPLEDQEITINQSLYSLPPNNPQNKNEMKAVQSHGAQFSSNDLKNHQQEIKIQDPVYLREQNSANTLHERNRNLYAGKVQEIYVGNGFPEEKNQEHNVVQDNGESNADVKFNQQSNNRAYKINTDVKESNNKILIHSNQNQLVIGEQKKEHSLVDKQPKKDEQIKPAYYQQHPKENIQLFPFPHDNGLKDYNKDFNLNNFHHNVIPQNEMYNFYPKANAQPVNNFVPNSLQDWNHLQNSPNVYPYDVKPLNYRNFLQNQVNIENSNNFPQNIQLENEHLKNHGHYEVVHKPLEVNYHANAIGDESNHKFLHNSDNINEIVRQDSNSFYANGPFNVPEELEINKLKDLPNNENLPLNQFQDKSNNKIETIHELNHPVKRELPSWDPHYKKYLSSDTGVLEQNNLNSYQAQPNIFQHWRGILQVKEIKNDSDEKGYYFDRDQHIGRNSEQNSTGKPNVYLYYYPLFEQMRRMNENRQLNREKKIDKKKPATSRKLLKQKFEECHAHITGLAASALAMYIRYMIDPGPDEFHHIRLNKPDGDDVQIVNHNDEKELFHGEDEEALPPYKIGEVGNIPYHVVEPSNVKSYESNNWQPDHKKFEPLFIDDVRKKLHPEESEDYVRKADIHKELTDKVFLPLKKSSQHLSSSFKALPRIKNDSFVSPKADKLHNVDFPDIEYVGENSNSNSFVNARLLNLHRHLQTELVYHYAVIIIISFLCIFILYKYLRYKRYLLRHRTKSV